MDFGEPTALDEYTDEEHRGKRRQLAQQAIALSMQGRWQEAADVNQQIVDVLPSDAEAYNRIGKAYSELGRISEARDAYQNALNADPANLIAQRNLDRLSLITESEASELAKQASSKLDPRFFMEETGKTELTSLVDTAAPNVLATLAGGNEVKLQEQDGQLAVTTVDGVYLGRLDDKLATRLLRFINSGNEYQAGVVGVDDNVVRIIVRETLQSPQNAGRLSFPPKGSADSLPRPYLREGLRPRPTVSDDEDEDDLELDVDADSDDEEDDPSEFGFHEANLDES